LKISKYPKEFINHILDEIKYLLETSQNLSFESFLKDETLKRAFVRSIEIIGEAVKKIPRKFKEKQQQIEWKKIAGMRDKLIHKYFGVDYNLVWDVIKKHIPKLNDDLLFLINNV